MRIGTWVWNRFFLAFEDVQFEPDFVIYTSLLGVCARAAASRPALALWESIGSRNLVTYCEAITACEKGEDVMGIEAISLMEEMSNGRLQMFFERCAVDRRAWKMTKSNDRA